MKVIIAGGRSVPSDKALILVKKAVGLANFEIDEVVSGTATGIDSAGEKWAEYNSVPIKRFPADWAKHGRSAGTIRNNQMAQYADALIAIWDTKSPGTRHMIETARKLEMPYYVLNYSY